jgi:type I restriction enzyme S subunit
MSKEPIRFKQTEIGELPEEWEVVRLEDVARVFSGSSAPQGWKYFENGIFPFVRVQDLARYGQTRCLTKVTDKVNERAVQEHHMVLARKGTILFPKSGAALEKNHRAILGVDAYIVSHLAAVEANPEKVDNEFLFCWLCRIDMASLNPNPGYPSIRLEEIKNLTIPLPPLEEQKRIARVLRLVDRVAEETRRIVNIYERAKRFALKRLLTRGIGHTRFKQTEMGELPEGWEVKPLREVLSLSQGGIWGDEPDNSVDVFPVLRSTEIDHEGNLHLDSPTMAWRKVPRQKAERYALKDGDILVVKSSGSAHLLGRVALFHQQGEQIFLFSNFLHRLRANDEICNSIFLYYVLISPIAKQTLKQIQETTSGLRNLPMDEYLQMPIPLPPLEEQKQIVEMLSTIDAAIENERRYLRVLEKCKRWLLDNLLTGKIRLSPEVDEILKGVLPDAF